MRQALALFLTTLLILAAPVWAEEDDAAGPKSAPVYVPLDPPFVLNLGGGRGTHFMQIRAQLAVGSKDDADAVTQHMPVVRNAMIMYFSGKTIDEARSVQQRETWRQELQAELQAQLKELTQREVVRGLYFTGFVIQ